MTLETEWGFDGLRRLDLGVKSINMRQTVDDALQEVLEDEFVPHLTEKIKQKGLIGRGPDKGPGPHISSEGAWIVQRNGNMDYTVKPIPIVRKRVGYLEFGTQKVAPIEPTSGDFLQFQNQHGQLIRVTSVKGVEEQSFFRKSVQDFRAGDRVARKVEQDIEEHVRKHLELSL